MAETQSDQLTQKPINIRRGDIFMTELPDGIGSEQRGTRPAIILQNDVGNRYSPTVQIVPITAQVKNKLPTHVLISGEYSGLKRWSIALAEQIDTIDTSRLLHWIGRVDNKEMAQIENAVRVQLGL